MTDTPSTRPQMDEELDPFEKWFASMTRAEQQERLQHSYHMRMAWNAARASLPLPPAGGAVITDEMIMGVVRSASWPNGTNLEYKKERAKEILEEAFFSQRRAASAPAQSGVVEEVRAAFETVTMKDGVRCSDHALHNLEGAIIDIEWHGKADAVSLRTLHRVAEQLARIEQALATPSKPAPVVAKLTEEFFAKIYVQAWDQHIGQDGAIAILNAIDSASPQPDRESEIARPLAEWHEDFGPQLWWNFPIEEPPYAGTPLDQDWPGYHTHFTAIKIPTRPQATEGE